MHLFICYTKSSPSPQFDNSCHVCICAYVCVHVCIHVCRFVHLCSMCMCEHPSVVWKDNLSCHNSKAHIRTYVIKNINMHVCICIFAHVHTNFRVPAGTKFESSYRYICMRLCMCVCAHVHTHLGVLQGQFILVIIGKLMPQQFDFLKSPRQRLT
jgi:hypothetical protein